MKGLYQSHLLGRQTIVQTDPGQRWIPALVVSTFRAWPPICCSSSRPMSSCKIREAEAVLIRQAEGWATALILPSWVHYMAIILWVSLCDEDITGRQPLQDSLGGHHWSQWHVMSISLHSTTSIGSCGFGSTCLAFKDLILEFASHGTWGE